MQCDFLWFPDVRLAASDQPPPLLVVFQVKGPTRRSVLHWQCVRAHGQRLCLCRAQSNKYESVVYNEGLSKDDAVHLKISILPALGTCRSILTSKSWTLNKSSERSVVGLGTSLSLWSAGPCDTHQTMSVIAIIRSYMSKIISTEHTHRIRGEKKHIIVTTIQHF